MIVEDVREFFLQREATSKVASRPPALQAFVSDRVARASTFIRAATENPNPSDALVAYRLYEEALLYLAEAHASTVRNEVPECPSRQTARDALLAYVAGRPIEALLSRDRDTWPESSAPPPAEVASNNQALGALCGELLAAIEPRTRVAVRFARISRLTAIGVAVGYVLYLLVSHFWRGENLALHARVTASSQLPGTPDPRGAANGKVESDFGVHTQKEREPWVVVDLGAEKKIRRVIVYPRGDGYANESVPLVLEVSNDGHSFTYKSGRSPPFSQRAPWLSTFEAQARYVRVRMPTFGYIALSEIEVYAR
ncbi:MAG: discoidin domain-containing protein [Polyangiaceae bacterium]